MMSLIKVKCAIACEGTKKIKASLKAAVCV